MQSENRDHLKQQLRRELTVNKKYMVPLFARKHVSDHNIIKSITAVAESSTSGSHDDYMQFNSTVKNNRHPIKISSCSSSITRLKPGSTTRKGNSENTSLNNSNGRKQLNSARPSILTKGLKQQYAKLALLKSPPPFPLVSLRSQEKPKRKGESKGSSCCNTERLLAKTKNPLSLFLDAPLE